MFTDIIEMALVDHVFLTCFAFHAYTAGVDVEGCDALSCSGEHIKNQLAVRD